MDGDLAPEPERDPAGVEDGFGHGGLRVLVAEEVGRRAVDEPEKRVEGRFSLEDEQERRRQPVWGFGLTASRSEPRCLPR